MNDLTINLRGNILLQGNCMEILAQFPDESIDLVITDPPFNVLNKEDIKFDHRADITQNAVFDAFPTYDAYLDFTARWINLIWKKLKVNASLYIFFAAQYITDLLRICEKLQMRYKGILVWHKTNPAPKIRKSGYLSSTETILFMVKGNPTFNFLGQNIMHNLIETPICMGNERLKDMSINNKGKYPNLHPTQKPVQLYERMIEVSSNPEDLVVDPFAGTGTANIACAKLHRFCVGIENNEKYYQRALDRLKTYLKAL